ncbi:MAG: hypothetical protein QXS54_13195 [Candidatus Methanomethylicaceae archaeon]
MNRGLRQKAAVYILCTVLGAVAAWLTAALIGKPEPEQIAGKPEPRRIAEGNEYVLHLHASDKFAGNVFFLYHYADAAVTWRDRVRQKLKIKTIDELRFSHFKLARADLDDSEICRWVIGLIRIGVDVDGFGKAGDWVWLFAPAGEECPVALDGSAKIDTMSSNFRNLPLDYRWCNAVNGRFIDLIAE